MSSPLDVIRKRYRNCKKCNNSRFIHKDGKIVECECFKYGLWLEKFKNSGADENKVDRVALKTLSNKFKKFNTLAFTDYNGTERNVFAASAVYLAIKNGYYAEIFTDRDIIESIFNDVGVVKSQSELQRFLDPPILVLRLGLTRNIDFLGSHILDLILKREASGNNKKTLILIPSIQSIQDRYEFEDLNDYFDNDLRTRGALIEKGAK